MQNTDGKLAEYIKGQITVIIRTQGNRNNTLLDAIYSAVIQTYDKKEIIVVVHNDDEKIKSEIREIVRNIADLAQIRVVSAKGSKKRGHPLNVGMKNSKSEFISFLDDDDVLYPNALKVLITEANQNDLNFVYGNIVTAEVSHSREYLYLKHKDLVHKFGKPWNPFYIYLDNFIPIHSYVVRIADFREIEFNEEFEVLEDWDFILNLATSPNFEAQYIDFDVAEYRIKDKQSGSMVAADDHEIQRIKIKIHDTYKSKSINVSVEEIYETFPDINQMHDHVDTREFLKLITIRSENYQGLHQLVYKTESLVWLVKRIILVVIFRAKKLLRMRP